MTPGANGELICTWELKGGETKPAGAIAASSAGSSSGDRSWARKSRELGLWRWFVVTWLATGYVLTGVAQFLGGAAPPHPAA